MTSACCVRGRIEPLHEGLLPYDTDRVIWPEGEAAFKDVARVTPTWVNWLQQLIAEIIPGQIYDTDRAVREGDQALVERLHLLTLYTARWLIPTADQAHLGSIRMAAREATLMPSGRRRTRRKTMERLLRQDDFVRTFFAPALEGIPGPAAAFEGGEEVVVIMQGKKHPWRLTSCMSDMETMHFNIGLSDRVMTIMEACDEVRSVSGPRLPINQPLPPLF